MSLPFGVDPLLIYSVLLKSILGNNMHLCFSVNANPQAHMLLDTTGKYPRTMTPFIIKRHNILQMCSFSSCPRFVVIAAQSYGSLSISNFSLKKAQSHLSPFHSCHEQIRYPWNRPKAKPPTVFFYDISYSK